MRRRRCGAVRTSGAKPLAALAAALVCCTTLLLQPRGASGWKPPVFAVVFATSSARADLVAAGRDTWRKGVVSVAVMAGATEGPRLAAPAGLPPANVSAGAPPCDERWFTYPDDDEAWPERRAIAALRIANASLAGAYECVTPRASGGGASGQRSRVPCPLHRG
jgi:hypothetical protein